MSIYEFPLTTLSGESTSLAPYRGKVLLVVNVASHCGLTRQYDALEKLYARFKESGLVVLGFPANDFGAQEPGSNEEIATFCRTNYGVDFPMFSKIAVTGPATAPLYQALIAAQPNAAGSTRPGFRENLERTRYPVELRKVPGRPAGPCNRAILAGGRARRSDHRERDRGGLGGVTVWSAETVCSPQYMGQNLQDKDRGLGVTLRWFSRKSNWRGDP